jgi:replicative DNA helicase
MMTDQLLCDTDAEMAFLGSALIDQSIIATIDIASDDFYIHKHRWIWEAMQALGVEADVMTVERKLRDNGKDKSAGGMAYLSKLVNHVPSSLNAKRYAETIKDMAERRDSVALATELVQAAHNLKEEVDYAHFLSRLVRTQRVKGQASHISNFVKDFLDYLERRIKDPASLHGMSTGFPAIDEVTGGVHRRQTIIITGVPEIGKTMLACQIAGELAIEEPGGIYEMEMAGTDVVSREVSAQTKIQTYKMLAGNIDDTDLKHIYMSAEKISKLPIYFSEATHWSSSALRADLARLKALYDIGWVVVDNLFLLNDRFGNSEHEAIAYSSKMFRATCKDLDIAGIAIHNLVKDGFGKKSLPDLQSLRGSSQVSYDADTVMFMVDYVRQNGSIVSEQEAKNLRTLYFRKLRHGGMKRAVTLYKHPHLPRFESMTYQNGVAERIEKQTR